MKRKIGMCGFAALALILTACSTPYQDMGLLGGVKATQISHDTFQITARANWVTDPDTVQRYVLRKAAEVTVQAGYDFFRIGSEADRSQTSSFSTASGSIDGHHAWAIGSAFNLTSPGSSVLITTIKGPIPSPLPAGMFDAHEVLTYLAKP
jgi:hypothetical protein